MSRVKKNPPPSSRVASAPSGPLAYASESYSALADAVMARGPRPTRGLMVAPQSADRLRADVRERLDDLAATGAQLRHLRARCDELVPVLRAGGASWAQIGSALGLSAQTVRVRYRPLAEDA